MTYGTSANTYLAGRRPSRSSPHRRTRTVPIGKGPAIQHMGRGPIALTAHCAHCYLTHRPLQTSRTRPTSLPQLENQPPTEARCSKLITLAILAIFVKQTTYLAILPLFGHLALATLLLFGHLAQSLPTPEKFEKTKRNLFCARPLRSKGDLVRLLRFLRTFCTRHNPTSLKSIPANKLRVSHISCCYQMWDTANCSVLCTRGCFVVSEEQRTGSAGRCGPQSKARTLARLPSGRR